MANPTNLPGDLVIPGDCRLSGAFSPLLARSDAIAISENATFIIPWTWWRVWDAVQTNLPGTAANDDLALIGGTFGSNHPSIQTGDLKAAGATSRYARAMIPLPWNYVASQTVTLRFNAGMITTVSDTTATLDVECYHCDEDTTLHADGDICATAAQSINSLSFADIDFTITDANLVANSQLDVRITITVNDGATGTAVIGCVGSAQLLCDIR